LGFAFVVARRFVVVHSTTMERRPAERRRKKPQ